MFFCTVSINAFYILVNDSTNCRICQVCGGQGRKAALIDEEFADEMLRGGKTLYLPFSWKSLKKQLTDAMEMVFTRKCKKIFANATAPTALLPVYTRL